MQARAPVLANAKLVASDRWNYGFIDKGNMRYPARERWLPRGNGGSSGSGPSGWKLRKSKVLARSLADRKHGRG